MKQHTTCWHVGRSMIVWDVGSFDTQPATGGRIGYMAFVLISVGSLRVISIGRARGLGRGDWRRLQNCFDFRDGSTLRSSG